ncbi:MAG TPA: hypothetical protein VJG64_04340 [Candidatus Paceibacterota bacterium]
MSMESGLDARLQHRNESLQKAAGESLPLEDLKRLDMKTDELGNDEQKTTVDGNVNGLSLHMEYQKRGDYHPYVQKVTLNGHELREADRRAVFERLYYPLLEREKADKGHVDEVWDGAHTENRAFDEERDPYNTEVKPLLDQLLGKRL